MMWFLLGWAALIALVLIGVARWGWWLHHNDLRVTRWDKDR